MNLSATGVLSACLLVCASAHAQDGGFWYTTQGDPPPTRAPAGHDQGTAASQHNDLAQPHLPATERPFLYLVDPTLPQPWHAMASDSVSYSSTRAATRPLAATAGRGGLVNELRVEGALGSRVAPFATGMLAPPLAGEPGPKVALRAGFRVLLTNPASRTLHLVVAGGYDRDFTPTSGAFARVTASYDIGRLRLASMLHSEHAFARGRDPIDVYVDEGASYRVLDSLRVGAEYVGQDLEGAWQPNEIEGGIRHFAGVDLAWSYQDKILVTAGPAFGLSRRSPPVLGRATLSYLF